MAVGRVPPTCLVGHGLLLASGTNADPESVSAAGWAVGVAAAYVATAAEVAGAEAATKVHVSLHVYRQGAHTGGLFSVSGVHGV